VRGKPRPSGQDGAGGVAALGFSCRVCCGCRQADALIDSEKSFCQKQHSVKAQSWITARPEITIFSGF
jgi:hypothetical protein